MDLLKVRTATRDRFLLYATNVDGIRFPEPRLAVIPASTTRGTMRRYRY